MKKMITEMYCLDCDEMFIADLDSVDGAEHEACQGFNTEVQGSWYDTERS